MVFGLACHAEETPKVDVLGVTGAKVSEADLVNVFVSADKGADANSGFEDAPVASLKRAFDLVSGYLAGGHGVQVNIGAGIYRDTGIVIDGNVLGKKSIEPTLVIKGEPGVDWRGSEIRSDWEKVPDSLNVYRCRWTPTLGDVEVGLVEGKESSKAPRSPQHIRAAIPNNAMKASIVWSAPAEGTAKSYRIYRSSDPSPNQFQQIGETSDLKFSEALPAPPNKSYYRVTAVDEGGKESEPTGEVAVGWAVGWVPNDLGRRTEMVFLDGRLQRQVATRQEFAVGTFFVDEPDPENPGNSWILVQIPKDFEIRGSTVEVSGNNRSQLFIRNKKNVVVRDVRFQQAGVHPWFGGALSFYSCSNVLIEGNIFSWNNGDGMRADVVSDLSVRNNEFSDNGGSGFSGGGGRNQVWENNKFARNNWRGIGFGGGRPCFHAGLKTGFGLRNAVFRGNTFEGNQGHGLWLDSDMENILVENNRSIGNGYAGLVLEASHGLIEVKNTSLSENGEYGVMFCDQGGVMLENSTIFDNGNSQMCIAVNFSDGKPGRDVVDSDTNKSYRSGPLNISWYSNIIAAGDAGQNLVSFTWGNPQAYMPFFGSFRGGGNSYWHPTRLKAFSTPLPDSVKTMMDLEQWSRATGGGISQDTREQGTSWKVPDFSPKGLGRSN